MEVQNALSDKIVSCICTMDMRMLDVLLPDHGIYESTYKEVWLGRLNSFFTLCKMSGDDVLTVQRKACSVGIQCNCGQVIWLFDAEKPRRVLRFILTWMGMRSKGLDDVMGMKMMAGM